MLDEYELYQGAVLRQIIAHADPSVRISPFKREGRLSAFVLNERLGLFIKHSAKRLSPWQFTFQVDHVSDVVEVERSYAESYVAFVCRTDGVVLVTTQGLRQLINFNSETVQWVRIDRARRSMYGVHGTSGVLPHKLAAGTTPIIAALQGEVVG